MSKDSYITIKGSVIEVLPGSRYRVEFEENKHIVLAYLSGKMRQNRIKVVMGDIVDVEVNINDIDKGRISYRHK